LTKISRLLISICTLVSSGAAATVFTDGLPTGTDLLATTAFVGNFTVTTGDVDVLQSTGFFAALCAGSTPCVDLDGDTQGAISSPTLTLTPGTYTLTFTLNSAQRGTVASTTVTLGSLFNKTYTDPAPGIVTQTLTVATTTTVPLVFTSNTPGAQGDLLSAVSLVSTATSPSPVPEPSNLFLLSTGSAFLAFGSLAYRRKKIQNCL
jgi:hypothetical protein